MPWLVDMLELLEMERISGARSKRQCATGEKIVDDHRQSVFAGSKESAYLTLKLELLEFNKVMSQRLPRANRDTNSATVWIGLMMKRNTVALGPRGGTSEGRMNHWLFRERLLSNDYLAFVPEEAQEGDGIWILEAGKTPFVLRSLSRSESRWQLASDAYVHSAMEGERYDQENCETIELI